MIDIKKQMFILAALVIYPLSALANLSTLVQNAVAGGGSSSGATAWSGSTAPSTNSSGQSIYIPSATPGTGGSSDCDDLGNRVTRSKEDAIHARMPTTTPTQAMSEAGVFETMSKKISFLGDLLGDAFSAITSGNFSSLMDSGMNASSAQMFNSLGVSARDSVYRATANAAYNKAATVMPSNTAAMAVDTTARIITSPQPTAPAPTTAPKTLFGW